MRIRTFRPGDRVAYAAKFLRSIGGDFEAAERRGTVVGIIGGRVERITVRWDDLPHEPKNALPVNLAKVGSLAFHDPFV
jgi:hypothetical protein